MGSLTLHLKQGVQQIGTGQLLLLGDRQPHGRGGRAGPRKRVRNYLFCPLLCRLTLFSFLFFWAEIDFKKPEE